MLEVGDMSKYDTAHSCSGQVNGRFVLGFFEVLNIVYLKHFEKLRTLTSCTYSICLRSHAFIHVSYLLATTCIRIMIVTNCMMYDVNNNVNSE